MTIKPEFKSDAFEAIHSSAHALFKVGAMDKATLRNFDRSCIAVQAEISPEKSRKFANKTASASPYSPAF